jgi:hypothetical protein
LPIFMESGQEELAKIPVPNGHALNTDSGPRGVSRIAG